MAEAGEDFSTFVWTMAGGVPILHTGGDIPAKTPLSEEISAALKKRGFKFVGPVIVYAWMQATGHCQRSCLQLFSAKQCGLTFCRIRPIIRMYCDDPAEKR